MANKYLDNAGLDHMWDKIKTYLTNNYATKSALSSGLAGKANSSHTHTSSQITDLSASLNTRLTAATTNATSLTLPSLSVNQLRFFKFRIPEDGSCRLPSGGTYGIMIVAYNASIEDYNGVYSGVLLSIQVEMLHVVHLASI